MAFPDKPEPAKNGWIDRSIQAFKNWAFSRQPIPDQQDFDVNEGFDGVRFSLKKKPVQPEPRRDWREFHIEAAGSKKLRVSNGTLFGQLPTGFSANDDPVFEITARADSTPLQSGDKVYAKVTWNRTVSAFGDIVSTITTRTVEAAATVPTNDYLTATRHYLLATITLPASNIPVVSQTRWGPIDDLPGTASDNYTLRYGATGTADTAYYDLLYTSKGHKSDGSDIAPSYNSIQTYQSGLCRVYNDAGTMKIFIAPITVNSIGQITWIGPEAQAWP
jgi:hypothetical protein